MNSVSVELMVDDIQKTVEFYKTVLGFEVILETPDDKPTFAIIKSNNVKLMLYIREEFANEIPKFKNEKLGGSIALYIGVDNIKNWHKRLESKVKVVQKLHATEYGTEEFSFEDINGYVLMFHE